MTQSDGSPATFSTVKAVESSSTAEILLKRRTLLVPSGPP
jgi:hypothetical protein